MKKQWGPCDIVGFKQHLEDMLKRMFKEVIKKLSFPSTFFFFLMLCLNIWILWYMGSACIPEDETGIILMYGNIYMTEKTFFIKELIDSYPNMN